MNLSVKPLKVDNHATVRAVFVEFCANRIVSDTGFGENKEFHKTGDANCNDYPLVSSKKDKIR